MGREGVRAAVTTLAWTYECGSCCLRDKDFGMALGPVRREADSPWPLSLQAGYEGPSGGGASVSEAERLGVKGGLWAMGVSPEPRGRALRRP